MKMKEVEARTGLDRKNIRYYESNEQGACKPGHASGQDTDEKAARVIGCHEGYKGADQHFPFQPDVHDAGALRDNVSHRAEYQGYAHAHACCKKRN